MTSQLLKKLKGKEKSAEGLSQFDEPSNAGIVIFQPRIQEIDVSSRPKFVHREPPRIQLTFSSVFEADPTEGQYHLSVLDSDQFQRWVIGTSQFLFCYGIRKDITPFHAVMMILICP